jgi:hypothetical protein
MHRIDTDTASPDENGVGKDGFRAGSPPGVAATRLSAAWCNAAQEEIASVVEAHVALVKADNTQLLAYLQRQQVKQAISCLHTAEDTNTSEVLHGLARKASTGQVIVVGENGTIQAGGNTANFAAQTPGSSFTGHFYDVTYDSVLALYVAVGAVGEIQSSTGNGIWTRRANGGADFLAIASNALGRFVAVGGGLIKYSVNGTSWSTASVPVGIGNYLTHIAYIGAGRFVAATDNGGIISSDDGGENWTTRRAFDGAGTSTAFTFYPGLGLLYAYDSVVYHSADGVTWTAVQSSVGSFELLLASPACWLLVNSATDGTSAQGWYSATEVDRALDFTADYLMDEPVSWMRFVDGQLWALAGDKILAGGVL